MKPPMRGKNRAAEYLASAPHLALEDLDASLDLGAPEPIQAPEVDVLPMLRADDLGILGLVELDVNMDISTDETEVHTVAEELSALVIS